MSCAPPAPPTPLDPGAPNEDALAAAYAKGRDDERRRCDRILQAECDKLATAGMLRALTAIRSGKAAP